MSTNGKDYDGPILECKDLSISYFTRAGEIPAVVDFNLTLRQGDSVGLVGESGCGKSTVAMAIMQYMGHNGTSMSCLPRVMLGFSEAMGS